MGDSGPSILAVARLQLELGRLFQEARSAFAGVPQSPGAWQPPADILEYANHVVVLVELPDMGAADLTIEIQHDIVTIRGTRPAAAPRNATELPAGRFLRLERPHGTFERRIDLGRPVDGHQGRARLALGVLTIEFPRVLERRARPRRIAIEEGA